MKKLEKVVILQMKWNPETNMFYYLCRMENGEEKTMEMCVFRVTDGRERFFGVEAE